MKYRACEMLYCNLDIVISVPSLCVFEAIEIPPVVINADTYQSYPVSLSLEALSLSG